jgi:hypothetical protein
MPWLAPALRSEPTVSGSKSACFESNAVQLIGNPMYSPSLSDHIRAFWSLCDDQDDC